MGCTNKEIPDTIGHFFTYLGTLFLISLIILFIAIDSNVSCSDKPFVDIRYYLNYESSCDEYLMNISSVQDELNILNSCNSTPTIFYMEENLVSSKKEMFILIETGKIVGSFVRKNESSVSNDFSYKYRYKDLQEDRFFTVANIDDNGLLSQNKYELSRCINSTNSTVFRYEEILFNFNKIGYQLYKNDILIGESSEDIYSICKPDIYLIDIFNNPLASLTRGCINSIFRDKWNVINFKPELIDDYVIGFLGYITTLNEN